MSRSSLAPGRLNHIALASSDVERSARFYCETLNFRLVRRPSFSFDGRWLYREQVGPMIHLIHDGKHQPPAGPINTRGPHFAMYTDDYDQTICQLEQLGIEFEQRTLPDYGYRQVFFRDPDGNVVELGEWPDVVELAELLEV